ncbi:hypothetical protein D3C81_1697740 [compost metagenome]
MHVARRNKSLDLLTSSDHRLMRTVKLCELTHQPVGHLKGRGFVEHEITEESIEISQIFGRLRLMKQSKRHFALYSKNSAKAFAVSPKFVLAEGLGECLIQLAYVKIPLCKRVKFAQIEISLEN